MSRFVLALLASACLTAPVAAQQPQAAEPPPSYASVSGIEGETVIPFELGGPWIVVPNVTVNGEGPFVFQFDTGGQGGGRADVTLVEALGLEQTGEIQAGDGSGRQGPALPLYSFGTLSVGGITWTTVPVLSRDYNPPPAVTARGQAIDGILGMGLFADSLLVIDYPALEMRVSDRQLDAEGAHVAALVPSPIPTIMAAVNGAPVMARIDSGAQGAITLGGDVAAMVEFAEPPVVIGEGRTVSGSFEIRRAHLSGTIEIAGHVFENPEVVIVEPFIGLNIGGAFLRDHVLEIDQRNGLLRLTRPAE